MYATKMLFCGKRTGDTSSGTGVSARRPVSVQPATAVFGGKKSVHAGSPASDRRNESVSFKQQVVCTQKALFILLRKLWARARRLQRRMKNNKKDAMGPKTIVQKILKNCLWGSFVKDSYGNQGFGVARAIYCIYAQLRLCLGQPWHRTGRLASDMVFDF